MLSVVFYHHMPIRNGGAELKDTIQYVCTQPYSHAV